MKNKLVWRLSKLPTVSELQELVKNKIITQEEARDVLFKTEVEEEGRDMDSYKEEINFLRGLIEKLSTNNRSTVVDYIYSGIGTPWNGYHWYQPYVTWCSGSGLNSSYAMNTLTQGTVGTNAMYMNNATNDLSGVQSALTATGSTTSFTDISTF